MTPFLCPRVQAGFDISTLSFFSATLEIVDLKTGWRETDQIALLPILKPHTHTQTQTQTPTQLLMTIPASSLTTLVESSD